jgi:hypothetical protein
MTDRSEIERRFLALLRDYLDTTDERFPDGYEIEDFIFVYQMSFAPTQDETLNPWDGGSLPGWSFEVAFSSTTRSWAHDQALLNEAVQRVGDLRLDQRYPDDDASDEDDEDDAPATEPDAEADE